MIAEIGTNVAVSSTDICETEDPCQNGGVCITTDDGPVCDCSNIEFEGTFCEKGKHENNTAICVTFKLDCMKMKSGSNSNRLRFLKNLETFLLGKANPLKSVKMITRCFR